jgi:2-furoate---CoA ligase
MFDLGTSFLAATERDPDATAIVDGDVRLTYRQWYRRISTVAARLKASGLSRGDHVVTALQNRWEAATVHWACQFLGLIVTPVNWRAKAEEIDFFLRDSDARMLVVEAVSREAGAGPAATRGIALVDLDVTAEFAGEYPAAPDVTPEADARDWSLMLYTSGTTGNPKGVPRRHHAERAGAIAHVAQNTYRRGERTLGVMPLYHTMGVRSLLSMSLVGGTFVCLPRFDAATALALIEAERLTCLYLVPTLYHDLLHHPQFERTDIGSVDYLGFAGASMTDGLLAALQEAFRPKLFVNHYGSSEIYTFTIDQNAPAKPGSAGRAALNQRIRIARLGQGDPEATAAPGEEGEIVASLAGDEAFEGYWRRPDADAKSLRDGWYFTGDSGYFDADGDLFVTGRVDDMIITGGENVSPVEIESCLSLHPDVLEVAVAGLPDERWGRIVAAFVIARSEVTAETLDAHCRRSGLANFKRPRRYVFLQELPKSPVGKLLRRKLVAGDYHEIKSGSQARQADNQETRSS